MMASDNPIRRFYIVSYPRSGNTWVRLLLEHSLGFRTTSVYESEERLRTKAFDAALHPIRKVTGDDRHIVTAANLHLVKTHEYAVEGSDPIIYVLRDGREATASYWHFSHTFEPSGLSTFSDFLRSLVQSGKWWGTHVGNWLFSEHGHPKLVVRYEDLLKDPQRELERLMGFLDTKPVRPYSEYADQLEFNKLSSAWPEFFRAGKASSWRELFSKEDEEYFLANDNGFLQKLGYFDPSSARQDNQLQGAKVAAVAQVDTAKAPAVAQSVHAEAPSGALEGVERGQADELLLYYFLSEKIEPKHVVDVGAHRGFTLEPFVLAGWSADAFEPLPENLAELRRIYGKVHDLRIHAEAVSSVSGTASFHLARKADGTLHEYYHSIERIPDDTYHQYGETVQVPTVSLDDLVRQGKLPGKIGLLKIDTEGHDLKVLQGAEHLTAQVVSVEFWCEGHVLKKSPSPPEEMIALMKGRGYEQFIVMDHAGADAELKYSVFDVSRNSWGNILFFHSGGLGLFESSVRFCRSLRVLRDLRLQFSGRIASLENTARERLDLIVELERIAEERLQLIRKLSAECDDRLKVIQILDAEVKRLSTTR